MKKIIALMLALMMLLFSVSALAGTQTVTVSATVDKDVLKTYAPALNMEIDKNAEAVIALINALALKVVASDNAAELHIDLKDGQHLAAIGGAMSDGGVVLGSDLIPSYLFTISQEYIEQMMQQFMAQMPGGGQNIDMEEIANRFYGYIGKFSMAFQTAVTPGEAETVAFEAEGFTFDVKTPMNVDVKALAEAEKTLVSDILHDEFVADALKSSGQNVDVEQIIQQNAEAMSEEHLPDVTVDVYTSTANPDIFYVESLATYKGQDSAAFRFTMLNKGDGSGVMNFYVLTENITITVNYSQNGFLLEVSGNGAYVGLKVAILENGAAIEIYFMDPVKPVLLLEITAEEGGTFQVDLNTEGKTLISIEDIQNEKVDQSVQEGLMSEAQSAILPLAMKLMTAVPEAMTLFQGLMNGM